MYRFLFAVLFLSAAFGQSGSPDQIPRRANKAGQIPEAANAVIEPRS